MQSWNSLRLNGANIDALKAKWEAEDQYFCVRKIKLAQESLVERLLELIKWAQEREISQEGDEERAEGDLEEEGNSGFLKGSSMTASLDSVGKYSRKAEHDSALFNRLRPR